MSKTQKAASAPTKAANKVKATKTPKTGPATEKRARGRKPATIARDDYTMSARIRAKTKGDSIVTPNQLATMFGTNGKAVRKILRSEKACGNDLTYTRYGFDVNSTAFAPLFETLSEVFGKPTHATAKSHLVK